MNELFPELVKLEPVEHRYWHIDSGVEYASLSRVRETIKPKTDFKSIAIAIDIRNGFAKGHTQGLWNQNNKAACDMGTLIHDALELYGKTAQILPENEWLRSTIASISATEKDYYAVYREKTLYDEEHLIAATADRLLATTRNKGSIMDLDDYKTNLSKGITFVCKYKNYLLPPFEHLQNSNYYDYSLQLSCEAMMLEQLTGRKIGKLSITYIPPNNPLAWKVFPVAYLKNDAKILFKYYKELRHIKHNEEPSLKSFKEEPVELPNFG